MAERPPPLSPAAASLLRAYAKDTAMPEDARDRVGTLLREEVSSRRPAWIWAGVGALAAGLLLWGLVSAPDAMQTDESEPTTNQAAMQASETEGDTASRKADRTPTPGSSARSRVAVPVLEPEPPLEADPLPEPELTPPPPTPDPPAPQPRVKPRPKPKRPTPNGEAPIDTPTSRLREENALITQTWEHVRAKRYGQARATLRTHEDVFPDGVLAPERAALEVIVACLADPTSVAGKADAYAKSGRTALLSKVRSACTEEKSTPQ